MTWFAAPVAKGPAALANPAPASATAAPNAPITLTFARSVASLMGNSRPTVTPAVPGGWSAPNANTLVFTPSGFGFGPGTKVTVTFKQPVSVVGASTEDIQATASTTYAFTTSTGSTLRLQQILAQLGYLPLRFTPAPGVTEPKTFAGEVATMSRPLAGTFSWRWATTPVSLMDQWSTGTPNVLVKGALMAFLSDENSDFDGFQVDPETVGQIADASTWQALLQAAASNQVNPHPYSYVYVSQNLPQTLTLWQDGSVVAHQPRQHRHLDPPDRDRHLPRLRALRLQPHVGNQPGRQPLRRPGVLDQLLQWRRRRARLCARLLRLAAEPGLRGAAHPDCPGRVRPPGRW